MTDEQHIGGDLIPSLPNDIAVRCIARVPRLYHPYLSHVSRSWRSLLHSPLLSAVRSDLGITEPFLLVNIRSPTDQSQWFVLHRRRRNPSPLPSPPLAAVGSAAAAIGAVLFLLGGSVSGVPSSAVQVFDARRRRWSLGPRMSSAREFAAAAAIDGRIYAVGGCIPPSEAWAEALDPVAGDRWSPVPSPPEIREKWMHGCAVLAGKLLAVADRGGVVYDPAAEPPWGTVPVELDLGWRGRAAVVGEMLYSYDFLGKIKGYDPQMDEWKTVEGVEKELPKFLCGATLANLGGVLCVVWEGKGDGRRRKEMVVDWAGITVSKTQSGGLQGKVLWTDSVVLALPKGSSVAHCLALEL
ncbi:F-box/kelch-repeat protein SKIP6-like [Typha latifolia]|uniref:F-box/kelch-repeat protein SKIP6-like n=1 Tax=Typha latifolia TaxID=4733 RepID=UPI003C2E1021